MTRWIPLFLAVALAAAPWAVELPLTHIMLSSSGMGYFQRSGFVTDNATVEMSFKPSQINDLLKSMVLLDLDGGRAGSVVYRTKDPISKTLEAFSINITDNPTFSQLLLRMRGLPAEVEVGEKTLSGKIFGLENKSRGETLMLFTATGLRSVPLDSITAFRLLDEKLNKELQDALDLIAFGLDNQHKPVVATFNGTGKRRVVIGYMAETPVWKTSYRLVLSDKTPLLQGWAIVENTSDTDWNDVSLSFVSSRPISFTQDLYTSLFIPRPEVRTKLYTSLLPVTYEANKDAKNDQPPYNSIARADAGGYYPNTPYPATPAAVPTSPYNAYGPGGLPPVTGSTQNQAATPRASLDPSTVAASVVSTASTRDLGQAFEYTIKDTVTIPRQQSALIPILTNPLAAKKVSIYNQSVHPKFPLCGVQCTNSTGLCLAAGPVTVYDGDTYGGDTSLEDLAPGESRLLSYAIDTGVNADRQETNTNGEIVGMRAANGTLTLTYRARRVVTYTFTVKTGAERAVIVEHPFNAGWDLVTPVKSDERTNNLYRFYLTAAPDAPGKLVVTEDNITVQSTSLLGTASSTIRYYAHLPVASEEVTNALDKLATMQEELAAANSRVSATQSKLNTIRYNQDRLRNAIDSLTQQLTELKKPVAVSTTDAASLERTAEQLQLEALRARQRLDQIAQIEKSLKTYTDEFTAKEAETKTRIDELTKQLIEAQNQAAAKSAALNEYAQKMNFMVGQQKN